MAELTPGEIVDITIRGARIVTAPIKGQSRSFTIRDEHGLLYRLPPQAAIEHVAPAEWPPRPGDLWRDHDGHLWLAAGSSTESTTFYAADGRGEKNVTAVRSQLGPLALVHREDVDLVDDPKTWTDGAGHVWDLTARYADRYGKTWHWAGGFESPPRGATPMEPLISRDDWSIQDVRLGALLDWHGPLTIVQREEATTDE